jgi:4-hydroxy-tetrahydrodipicolinate reductase
MLELLIIGGGGRMGGAIVDAAGAESDLRVAAVCERRPGVAPAGVPAHATLDGALEAAPRAVVVDVSSPAGAAERIAAVAAAGRPLVEGTTGFEAEEALIAAAERVALVVAPNFSPGVALLGRALSEVLRAAGPRWDAAVLDRHHRMKRDAPSGTARLLERTIRRARGDAGPDADETPLTASFRQGGLVGEHHVFLTSGEEELVFTHRAFNRLAFAHGALLAARFAAQAPPGLYGMDHVLGLVR